MKIVKFLGRHFTACVGFINATVLIDGQILISTVAFVFIMKRSKEIVTINKNSFQTKTKKIICGKVLLQLNGAGTKKALVHNSNNYSASCYGKIIKGRPRYNILSEKTNKSTVYYIISENIISGAPICAPNLKNSDTASAVVETVVAEDVDHLFELLQLNDVNYVPQQIYVNHHKFKNNGFYTFTCSDERTLNAHLEIMYKCMLVQAFNFHRVWEYAVDNDCDSMEIEPSDIEYSLNFWAIKLGYPEKITKDCVKKFMKKITLSKINKDSEIAKGSSWQLRRWFDGDNWQERLRITPDVKLLPIYEYGSKDAVFNKIVTYDGDMCLKMPGMLRKEIQAMYQANPKECRKILTDLLKDKFVIGKDVNGDEHNFDTLFRSCKDRKVTASETFDIEHFKSLLKMYPDQTDAKNYIQGE